MWPYTALGIGAGVMLAGLAIATAVDILTGRGDD